MIIWNMHIKKLNITTPIFNYQIVFFENNFKN
jgi:hypothetical protein